MTEEFLHFVWHNKLFAQKNYIADTGEEIEIIDTGIRNYDAGPDFFNAKIKIENTIWAGNVEIHLKSSDWNVHHHNKDKAYNNVILHVVKEYNAPCLNSDRKNVQTIQLEIPDNYIQNYNLLLKRDQWIPCEKQIIKPDNIIMLKWIERLTIERLESKTGHILRILENNKFDWEESFYQILARSFGFGVNSEPFEMLAKSLPLKILAKHKTNIHELQALLFGQSGLLGLNEVNDNFTIILNRDYRHLKNKYNLVPVDAHLWKFLRLRPVNFPTIRIEQFVNLIYKSSHLLSRIIEAKNINEMHQLFESKVTDYWHNKYLFGKTTKIKNKDMGKESVHSIIINTVVPFLFLYGNENGKSEMKEKAVNLLYEIPVEKNNIIIKWQRLGISCTNSFDTQALIHLKKEYCDKRKCLNCMIGNNLIRNSK